MMSARRYFLVRLVTLAGPVIALLNDRYRGQLRLVAQPPMLATSTTA
ncbi:MAG: hypothetical protein WAU83_07685 [Pseudonocardiaceae bacterium]